MIARSVSARGRTVGESHPNTRYPDALVAQVRQMHAGGYSYRTISQQMGIPKATIACWITGDCRSIPTHRIDKLATEGDYPTVRELRIKGMSREQIVETTGYSRGSVYKALKAMNLNKRMRRQ